MVLEERLFMMAFILRLPELFAQAATHFKAQLFSESDEPHLRLLWRVIAGILKQHGTTRFFVNKDQTWNMLSAECSAYIAAHPTELPEVYREQLLGDAPQGFLAWTFNLQEKELVKLWGQELIIRFLEERWVQDPMRRAIDGAGNQTLANLNSILREVREREALVTSLTGSESEEVIPDGWIPQAITLVPTNVPFIDKILNGGDAAKETYGVLGAFKAGKTTLAIQIVSGTARYELGQRGRNPDHELRFGYMFTYEAGADESRSRIISHMARISRATLMNWGKEPLSTAGNYKPYELAAFKAEIEECQRAGVPFGGEKERYEAAKQHMQQLRIFDMSGPIANPKQGSGGLDEIAMKLDQEAQHGRKPRRVVIDYAGLCVNRFCSEHGVNNPSERFQALNTFGYDTLRKIAVPYDCSVWIMHQLSGQANKATWAKKQSHADAAGGASFAENLVTCFQLGIPHPTHKGSYFSCGVSRRTDVGEPILVRLDGLLGTIRDASSELLDRDGELVLKSEFGNIHRSVQPRLAERTGGGYVARAFE
jgi:hypothetical protein